MSSPDARERTRSAELEPALRGPVSTMSRFGTATRTLGGTFKRAAKVFAAMLGVMGVMAALNAVTGGAVDQALGLLPRTARGAWGIVLHPLLHANFQHLAMNAIGLVLIGGTVFLRSERDFWRVTLLGTVLGGSATWLIGRPNIHVGASGLVFAYLGYLLTTGWFDRKLTSVALSIVAGVLWGSALWGLSPMQNGISWELHLFGLLGGVVGAWWRKRFSNP
ncbi:MAG: rhomboid family intramembrane serine protease [Gemmatimonadaceae bacterium]